MKKFFHKLSLCLLASVLLCAVMVSPALARDSNQIRTYTTSVTANSGGKLAINFSVTGKGTMTQLGASSITIKKYQNSNWVSVKTYSKSSSGMTASNKQRYSNTITFSGTAGTYYQITVTVFATDSSGTDSYTKTHYVTAIA